MSCPALRPAARQAAPDARRSGRRRSSRTSSRCSASARELVPRRVVVRGAEEHPLAPPQASGRCGSGSPGRAPPVTGRGHRSTRPIVIVRQCARHPPPRGPEVGVGRDTGCRRASARRPPASAPPRSPVSSSVQVDPEPGQPQHRWSTLDPWAGPPGLPARDDRLRHPEEGRQPPLRDVEDPPHPAYEPRDRHRSNGPIHHHSRSSSVQLAMQSRRSLHRPSCCRSCSCVGVCRPYRHHTRARRQSPARRPQGRPERAARAAHLWTSRGAGPYRALAA